MLAPPKPEASKRLESPYYVEGYAANFERYLLWDGGDARYFEEISPDAFAGADMGDVVMQYDHSGKVLARNRNGTLGVEADQNGLFVYADLSKSAASKEMYEEISAGLVDRMSWAFTVESESMEELGGGDFLRRIERIKKVYDVSAVSCPANDGTVISARSGIDPGAFEKFIKIKRHWARKRALKIRLEMEA